MGSRFCGAAADAGATAGAAEGAATATGGRADAAALDADVSDGAEDAGEALLAAAWLDVAPPPPDWPQLHSSRAATPSQDAMGRALAMAYLAVIMIDDTQPRLPVSSSTSHHTPFFWPVGKTLSPAWNWRTIFAVGEAVARMAMACLTA